MTISFEVDGLDVEVPDGSASLLEVLRDTLGIRSVKDGCSPQGQCGCCTVLVDGAPRISCVTPVRRVAGRSVTTIEGLGRDERNAWAERFIATGASQCGFCTPGIVMRLESLRTRGVAADDTVSVDRALQAHLCRCTGWQTIHEAFADLGVVTSTGRDLEAASRRATIEGRSPQRVGPEVVVGHGGFADDTAPQGALIAVPDGRGDWVVAESLGEARALAGKVQGRHSTAVATHPLAVPQGDWTATLRTTWVEPAYLETDASWCEPGGEPVSALGNGGAFGAKSTSVVTAAARELADRHGRAVRVLASREDVVRLGPKRPPIAAGVRDDGSGIVRVVRTRGIAERIIAAAPGLVVEEIDVVGPATSSSLRGAGWAEAAVLAAGARGTSDPVRSPEGAVAEAEISPDGRVSVRVRCGQPLDEVVLRSYCIGAAHMALGWVTSEAIAVDSEGSPVDLTIRSFGILRSSEMPQVDVEIVDDDSEPINGSDAVFAAVAAATWLHQGCPPEWPTGVGVRA